MQGAAMARIASKADRPLTATRIKRMARQAELESATGASGLTLLKFEQGWSRGPIDRMVTAGEIGPAELQAAHDISLAFHSMTSRLGMRGQSYEMIDFGEERPDRVAEIDAQRRYKSFANHWSAMRGRTGTKLLKVLIAAVIDERPFYITDADMNLRNGTSKRQTIAGLHDYAIRAGWIRY